MYPQDIDYIVNSPSAPPIDDSIYVPNIPAEKNVAPIASKFPPTGAKLTTPALLASKPPLPQPAIIVPPATTTAISTSTTSNNTHKVSQPTEYNYLHYPNVGPVSVPPDSIIDSIASRNSSIASLSPLQRLYSAHSSNSAEAHNNTGSLSSTEVPPPIQFDEELNVDDTAAANARLGDEDANSVQSDSTVKSRHEQEEEVAELERASFVEPSLLFDTMPHSPEPVGEIPIPEMNYMEQEEEPEVVLKVKKTKRKQTPALVPA